MQALSVFHKLLADACPAMHATRLTALLRAVQALLDGRELTLTRLGRAQQGLATTKSNINRIDRLLNNRHVQQERTELYAVHAALVLGRERRPVILIDWSDVTPQRAPLLRASVSIDGRGITLYEEVHPLEAYDNAVVRKKFLRMLKGILPADCLPILVTDAGFRGTWFTQVRELGWDFIGRVRNRTQVCFAGQADWRPCKTLYAEANQTAQALGAAQLTRSKPVDCPLYRYRGDAKQRHKLTRDAKPCRSAHSLKHAQGAREPWLLASSLSLPGDKVVRLYRQRMRIEQGFRDSKSLSYGFGLSASRTRRPQRLQILLLLGMMASWLLWLTGLAYEQAQLHRHLQANSIKDRRVLSTVFIGWQAMWRGLVSFLPIAYEEAVYQLRRMVAASTLSEENS